MWRCCRVRGAQLCGALRAAGGHARQRFSARQPGLCVAFLPCASSKSVHNAMPAADKICERVRQVIDLRKQGRSVPCQRTAVQARRERAFRGLVQQLLATDVHNEAAVQGLLACARQRGAPQQQLGSASASDVSASA